jgi:hypothetical protein
MVCTVSRENEPEDESKANGRRKEEGGGGGEHAPCDRVQFEEEDDGKHVERETVRAQYSWRADERKSGGAHTTMK